MVATLTSVLGLFMGSSVNVALPSMADEFAMSSVMLGWVNMTFLLAAAAFAIPFGRLGDIYGRKRIYSAGVMIFTLASVALAVANSGVLVIVARAIQGFGSSMIFADIFASLARGKSLAPLEDTRPVEPSLRPPGTDLKG